MGCPPVSGSRQRRTASAPGRRPTHPSSTGSSRSSRPQRRVDFLRIAVRSDHARADPLPGIDERSRHQPVGAHARHVGVREGRCQRGDGIGGKSVIPELERAAAGERDIGETERRRRLSERHEALNAPGLRKVERRAAFGSVDRRQSREPRAETDEAFADADGVVDRESAVGGGEQHPIGGRTAPVLAGLEPLEAQHRAHQASDVSRVAVGVPTRGADDGLSQRKIIWRVERGHDHERMIRHDMTIPGVFFVAVAPFDFLPGVTPVGVAPSPVADIRHEARLGSRARSAQGRHRQRA